MEDDSKKLVEIRCPATLTTKKVEILGATTCAVLPMPVA